MNTEQTNDWSGTTYTYWEDRHESIFRSEANYDRFNSCLEGATNRE